MRGCRRVLLAIGIVVGSCAAGGTADLTGVSIAINGEEVPADVQPRATVEQLRGVPDIARVALTGPRGAALASAIVAGADIRVDVRTQSGETTSLFTGEVREIRERRYRDQPFIVLHAVNRLQRLAVEPKTRSFAEQSFASILGTIAAEHGLVADLTGVPDRHYESVFQPNLTDFEFLLELGQEYGVEPAVVNRTLLFRPIFPGGRPVIMSPASNAELTASRFLPRLSSTSSLQQVIVNAVHEVTGEPITGRTAAPTVPLDAAGSTEIFGRTLSVEAETPLASTEDADALARKVLARRLSAGVSAEALAEGGLDLSLGTIVTVEGLGTRFDGAYYVTGVSHRFDKPDDSYGEPARVIRLRRGDLGLFRHPEIDDEVLVAFESGDANDPVVVGSLWDQHDPTRPSDRCEDPRCEP